MDEQSSRTNNESVGRALQNLLANIKVLASDTRDLLRETAGQSGERFTRLRERTRQTLSGFEEHLGPLQHKVAEQGRYAAHPSAEHLRVHRWSTVAAVAAIAFAVAAVLAWQNETAIEDDREQRT
jgi:ElaB/YqjD/DUF883 family membrane-anchored ribosome-binding protein